MIKRSERSPVNAQARPTQTASATNSRVWLILPAALALISGVMAGLGRLGVPVPAFALTLVTQHGPLMICGLFGTLIGLERAVAVGGMFALLTPIASAIGVFALFAGFDTGAAIAASLAAMVMTAVCVRLWLSQRVAHLATLALAAACWLAGNLIWLFNGVAADASLPWFAFLILTIAGERLELSRLVPVPRSARRLFAAAAGALALAAITAPALPAIAEPVYGACLLALAVWLQRYDIARKTLRLNGLTKYIAICLLSGYVWLAVAGALGLAGGFSLGSPLRDAALHALALGFVFAMVFGHAPIILPAVARIQLPWHPLAYLPLCLLHLGVLLRTLASLADSFTLRQGAAIGNAVALATFVALVLTGVATSRRGRK